MGLTKTLHFLHQRKVIFEYGLQPAVNSEDKRQR